MKNLGTKIAAVLLVAATYALHEPIFATLRGDHPRIFGVVSAALVMLAGVGVSGPRLWPALATVLGNGPLVPPTDPIPADQKKGGAA